MRDPVTADHDDEIRARLRVSDASALELIYDRHAPTLRAYATALAGAARADDLVQDVLVQVARRPELVARAEHLPAYLMRMTRNRALDVLRGDAARERPLDATREPSAPEAARTGVDAEAIDAALATLPAEQREVVALKIDGGLTFAAIAELLGIPMNTAASRYRYALEKLARLLPRGP